MICKYLLKKKKEKKNDLKKRLFYVRKKEKVWIFLFLFQADNKLKYKCYNL